MVAHDLWVAARGCPGYHIVHHIGKGQGQVVGLALAQHFGKVALGAHVQQKNFFALQRKTSSQVVRRWCSYPRRLSGSLRLSPMFLPSALFLLYVNLAAHGEMDGYVWRAKKGVGWSANTLYVIFNS